MKSLREAAEEGRLDDCRRLVEEEGKDVNEEDIVSICIISIIINRNCCSHTTLPKYL
jgi:hypothetical protein